MSDVLDRIVAHKRGEIAAAQAARPAEELRALLSAAPPVRDFVAALRAAQGIGLIAEVKKASPSAGVIREDFDPVKIAHTYESAGAACISCLTDEHFFQGHLDFLKAIRASVSLPVMRKDFLLDRHQVLEARVAGADCVLLIAECLDDETLADLYAYTHSLGMEALVEIYEPENLERVLRLEPTLLGVNNRNLRTFETDLDHTLRVARTLPETTLLVSESGISTRKQVMHLQESGVGGILVGESLMRSPDIGHAVHEILGTRSC
ncbi:MAG: indole-3-glycerol-phosphate synthase [Planctomycetaceae bacterium]|nr:indole-3-glycerol-phosphate synthase [Planctomycetaceae bacterium]